MTHRQALWRRLDLVFLLFLVGTIGVQRFGHSSLHYVTTVNTESRFWRGPFPEGRVVKTDASYIVKGEPIYWEFYAPRVYRKASLRVHYRATHERVRIGFQKKDGSFVFQDLPKTGVAFEEKELVFLLDNSVRRDRSILKVVLSAPGVTAEQGIEIQSLTLDASL